MLASLAFIATLTLLQDDLQSFQLPAHTSVVEGIAVASKEGLLASADWDGKLRLWDLSKKKKSLHEIDAHPGKMINGLDAAPLVGRVATAGDDGTVRVWDVATGKKLHEVRVAEFIVNCVALSPDGQRIATRYGEWDDEVRIWDAATGETVYAWKGIEDGTMSLAFDTHGQRLAAGSYDGRIRIWKLGEDEPAALFEIGDHNIYDLAFSPDGRQLAAACGDHSVRIFDPAAKKELARYAKSGAGEGDDGQGMVEVAWSPDGEQVVAGSTDGIVRIWSVKTGRPIAELPELEESISAIAVTAKGDRLLYSGGDGVVRVTAWPKPRR